MPFLVTAAAKRPADIRDVCFYCKRPIGAEHGPTCALVCRKAKIRMTVEYEVTVSAHWNKHDVEFWKNESSSCASNVIQDLENLDRERGCLCGLAHFECLEINGEPYLGEG